MSDTPVGPDWWQASDGKWYPPDQHPDNRPPEPAASQWGSYGQQPPPSYGGPPPNQPPYGSQPPYGAPPYGGPQAPPYGQTYQTQYSPYGGYVTGPQTSSKATIALVLSIVSFVVCPVIPAIVALVFAAQASREIRDSNGRFTGQGLVTASRIISIANIALVILATVAFVAVLPSAVDEIEDVADTAQDRFAQSELESAAEAADMYYEENGAYPMNPQALAQFDASLTFVPGVTPNTSDVIVGQAQADSMTFGTVSSTTECFYIRTTPETWEFARDVGCGPFSAQIFGDSW